MGSDNSDKKSNNEDDMYEIEVVTREEWGAQEAKSKTPLPSPIKDVVYTETDTKTCKSKKECIKVVKELQRYHMDMRGLPDIQHHFLIGGDGKVYEGRGWFIAGESYNENSEIPPELSGKCLEIAFIGKYNDDVPQIMKDAVNGLVSYGIENKFLVIDEEMLVSNETEPINKSDVKDVKESNSKNETNDENKTKKTKKNKPFVDITQMNFNEVTESDVEEAEKVADDKNIFTGECR